MASVFQSIHDKIPLYWETFQKAKTFTEYLSKKVEYLTSDRSKTLLRTAGYNLFVGTAVAINALTESGKLAALAGQDPCADRFNNLNVYNPTEHWTDVLVHGMNALTCVAQVFTDYESSKTQKIAVKVFTDITIAANQARLAGIVGPVIYGTNTIPMGLEGVDIGNHITALYVIQKWKIDEHGVVTYRKTNKKLE